MNNQEQFFNISLACDSMGKIIDQILEQCDSFDPQLITANSFSEDAYETLQSFFDQFDAKVGFHCHFKLQNYEAFSFIGIDFVSNTAVECIISLGTPDNLEHYSSELGVTKEFLVSLEDLYLNGRIQEASEPATRVYTWKKDNRTVVSFVSHPNSGSARDTGALLSVQIRDTQLHPEGAYFELLYNQAQKSVQTLKLS